jgi:transposase
MSPTLFSRDFGDAVEPLLPKAPQQPKGGRPRIADRTAFGDIIVVLPTGMPWRLLPQELGCGSGPSCWRRFRDGQEVGVTERLPAMLLNWLGDAGAIGWSRASLDSTSVRVRRGGAGTGPNPVDRGKHGSTYHQVVDRTGSGSWAVSPVRTSTTRGSWSP